MSSEIRTGTDRAAVADGGTATVSAAVADGGTATASAASNHQVTVVTTDGAELVFSASADSTILDAALDAGSTLMSLCGKGSCGVCRAERTSGTTQIGEHSAEALSAAEEAAGTVLLCCTRATSDVRLQVPYDQTKILSGTVPERRGHVSGIEWQPGDIVHLSVQLDADDEFGSGMQFDAGQFVELGLPDSPERRAYSFANTGNWDGVAEFYIKLRPGGFFSSYLERALVGDELVVRGPLGAFTLRENGLRPRWMVCGGTGLAPLLSMLRRMAEWQDPQPAVLILGVNTPAEVFATAELADLRLMLPEFRAIVPVVKPNDEWDGPVGNAVDVLDSELATHLQERPDIYLCGSPGFLVAARECAARHGIPPDQVYEERILAT